MVLLLIGVLLVWVHGACGDRYDRDCRREYILPFKEENIPLCGNVDTNTRTVVSTFAQIGDYGDGSQCQLRVSELMNITARKHNQHYRGRDDEDMDFIFTTGDNAYGGGWPHEFVKHVGNIYGKYFRSGRKWKQKNNDTGEFPPPHPEAVGKGQRFFPTVGNHDLIYLGLSIEDVHTMLPYTQYFDYLKEWAPVNASYPGHWYNYKINPHIELFCIDSNLMHMEWREEQMEWLEKVLRESTATFKLVFFHHNPLGSGTHNGPDGSMRLPFSVWGASAVFAGHVHIYERFDVCDDGGPPPCHEGFSLPYFISGVSGNALDGVYASQGCPHALGSQAQYVDQNAFLFGVLHVPKGSENTPTREAIIDFCLYSIDKNGTVNDTYTLIVPTPAPTHAPSTHAPSRAPSTIAPTPPPTTFSPTNSPTTASPTTSPTTLSPTLSPTNSPTTSPTTHSPTTSSPTNSPTLAPTTLSPTTLSPTTSSPTTHSPTTSSPTTQSPTTSSPTTRPPTAHPSTQSPTTSAPSIAVAWLEGMSGSGSLSCTNLLVVVSLSCFVAGMLCVGGGWYVYRKCYTSKYSGRENEEDEGDQDGMMTDEGTGFARALNSNGHERRRKKKRTIGDDVKLVPFREDS